MKKLSLFIITVCLSALCSAQELSFSLKHYDDNTLFVILKDAEEDINSLSKVKKSVVKENKKNKNAEAVRTIEQMEFEQFLLQLENIMYKRMGLRSGETPYHYIAKTGELKYLQFHSTYFKKFSINTKTDKFNSPKHSGDADAAIHYAISRNNNNSFETVKALVEKGADIKLKDKFGNSCLHLSAKENNMEMVTYFLDAGLNINDTNIFKNTAIHNAAYNNNKTMVDFLLSKGATIDDVNFKIRERIGDDKDYSTLMHTAVMNNWTDIIDKALEAGVSIDCKVYKSYYFNNATPLLYAVYDNNIEMTKYLLEKGANVNLYEYIFGYTPLTTAIHNDNREIFDMLMEHNPDVNIPTPGLKGFPIYHSLNEKGHHFAKTILLNPGYLNPKSDEATIIFNEMYARLSAQRAKLKWSKEIEPDIDDNSPLHWCAILGWDDLCEIIIKQGINVDITDEDGYTALQKAVQYQKYEAARILIKYKADPKLKNKYGGNAFSIAKDKKDSEMKKILTGK